MADSAGLPQAFDRNARYTRELHVSPDGSDENGDGSRAAPYASLNAALKNISPGTRIHMAAGLYPPPDTLSGLQGSADSPIAIVGQGDAVIDGGSDESTAIGLHLSAAHHVVIEGLRIQNTRGAGILVDHGGDPATPTGPVILRNIRIIDTGKADTGGCLTLHGVADFQILGSEFAACGQGAAIHVVDGHRGFISAGTFRDTPRNGIRVRGGSRDIVVHANRFLRIGHRSVELGEAAGSSRPVPADNNQEAVRIRIASNLFYRSGDAAIAFAGCRECLAAHNTLLDPQGHVVRLLDVANARTADRDNRFINNLIAFQADRIKGYITPDRQSDPESFSLGWNLWHARDRQRYRGPHHDRRISLEQSPITGTDPAFQDPGNGDYRLQANSPARGRGTPLPDHELPDYFGESYGTPPTIGAHAGTR